MCPSRGIVSVTYIIASMYPRARARGVVSHNPNVRITPTFRRRLVPALLMLAAVFSDFKFESPSNAPTFRCQIQDSDLPRRHPPICRDYDRFHACGSRIRDIFVATSRNSRVRYMTDDKYLSHFCNNARAALGNSRPPVFCYSNYYPPLFLQWPYLFTQILTRNFKINKLGVMYVANEPTIITHVVQ